MVYDEIYVLNCNSVQLGEIRRVCVCGGAYRLRLLVIRINQEKIS